MSEHDWYGPCDALLPDGRCSVCHGPLKIAASEWCVAHREWAPCPDCETADTIARLTRENEELRAAYSSASREWAERHEHARERILGLTEERDEAADAYGNVAAMLRRAIVERDEARAEAAFERVAANEWLTQLHDAQRELRAMRAVVTRTAPERTAPERTAPAPASPEDTP